MTFMHSRLALFVVVGTAALAATGCGSTSDEKTSSAAGSTTSASTSQATTAAKTTSSTSTTSARRTPRTCAPVPSKAGFRKTAKPAHGRPIVVSPVPGARAEVTLDASTILQRMGRGKGALQSGRAEFVVVAYQVRNTGRKSFNLRDLDRGFTVAAGSRAWRPISTSAACPGAGQLAASVFGRDASNGTVSPGKGKAAGMAYLVPGHPKVLTWQSSAFRQRLRPTKLK